MKVTTERLPKSLVALEIEPDPEMVEKELDRAARRLSQRVTIPGFRKGKAPRFIIESYFGREALLEEATDELINTAFRKALEQESIEPVGRAELKDIEQEPFRFRVEVPVEPTITLPDYRNIRVPLEIEPITDEHVQRSLNALREQHVVLQEPEEQRPARPGDQLTVVLETFVDGKPLEEREEGQEPQEDTLILEDERLLPELYEGLQGVQVGETREITAHVAEDHRDERVAGKDVTFKVEVRAIQERLLPEWEELPTLLEFEGDIDALRADVRRRLEETAEEQARTAVLNQYIEKLVESIDYDLPDAMIESQAEELLHRQEAELARYGITLDQLLQYRGQTHDQAVEEFKPQAERDVKVMLALRAFIRAEGLEISEEEIDEEIEKIVADTEEEHRDAMRSLIEGQNDLRGRIASTALNRKLRERIVAVATGSVAEATPQTQPDMAAQRSVEASSHLPREEEQAASPATTSGQTGKTEEA